MNKLFIILGQNGSIGKVLKKSLLESNLDVIGMNWNKAGSNNIKSNGLSTNEINLAIQEKRSLIIIDCLMGSSNFKMELTTHLNILNEFNKLNGSKYYIYLSTYEVDDYHNTRYREMKKRIEPIMISNGSYIIRFGCLCKSNMNLKSSRVPILVDEKFRPILLPYTYINDIVNDIKDINLKNKPQIIRCYSGTAKIGFCINGLKISLINMKSINTLKIPVPIISINILTMPIIKLLKVFIKKSKIIDLLEKLSSLVDHQRVLRSIAVK